MKSIARKDENIKVKSESSESVRIENLEMKAALIQALIPIWFGIRTRVVTTGIEERVLISIHMINSKVYSV